MSPAAQRGVRKGGVVVLTSGGPLANIVVNGLIARLGPVTVIEEQPETKRQVIRRRMRLLGAVTTLGEIGFGLVQRFLWPNNDRILNIWRTHSLDPSKPAGVTVHRVASVNPRLAGVCFSNWPPMSWLSTARGSSSR